MMDQVAGGDNGNWKNLEVKNNFNFEKIMNYDCLLYTSPSPRDRQKSRMPSSA